MLDPQCLTSTPIYLLLDKVFSDSTRSQMLQPPENFQWSRLLK